MVQYSEISETEEITDLTVLDHPHSASYRALRPSGVCQEAVGHRSGRFLARSHPPSAPGQQGNALGKLYFFEKISHFSRFP